ncbi:MAG TPA: cytochrome c oxidase assembly protein [Acidimicrobiales bacterium]|nr:cytochrome c oxidase assembly protein [Acidimicrobiales bacterium]
MNYVIRHWTFDPMLVIVVITVVAHEMGLRRLATHSRASRTAFRRRRSIVFYAALALLVLTIDSPIDYWSSSYFAVHMLEHILLSLAVPILLVVGAPWLPLLFALPVGVRRRVGRFFYLSSTARPLRGLGRLVRNPWVGVLSFNAAMLAWHIPSWFNLAEDNGFVHVWLMHGSFIVTGVLFWLQIFRSSPMKPVKGPLWQAGAILFTNVTMTILAMSMSIMTKVSWYSTYAHVPGVTLSPFVDQQIGAALLWVCGDFWALPTLIIVIRRSIDQQGSLSSVIDRIIGRAPSMTPEQFRRTAIEAPASVEGGSLS